MDVKRVLIDQREDLRREFQKTEVIKREINPEFIRSKQVKVAMGIRRCGKSFLFNLALQGSLFGYANFDDEILTNVDANSLLSSLIELYGDGLNTIFLDEIQNMDKWELFVNKLYRAGYNVFITGSNSKLLSADLATALTGRHLSIELFPFSFREYIQFIKLRYDGSTKSIGLLKHNLNAYIENGGFPQIVIKKEDPRMYLVQLYNDIIERDILARNSISYRATFKEMALSAMSNPGKYISYNSIKNNFNLGSNHTAKNYLDYLSRAYLLIQVSKFSHKPKEIEKSNKKIYAIDTGMAKNVSIGGSEDKGQMMENIVALDLMRRKSYWKNNMTFYYYKDYSQKEVDFVIKEGIKITQLIQVTYSNNRKDIQKREIESLKSSSDMLGCKDLIVITWDYEDTEKTDGKTINFIPLWKWLLTV
jgi:predicted AAA+ superfamily ATPase